MPNGKSIHDGAQERAWMTMRNEAVEHDGVSDRLKRGLATLKGMRQYSHGGPLPPASK
jgi:hypothetical protein